MKLADNLADRSTWTATGLCPVERTTSILGNHTALVILREAFYGTTRFQDFCERTGFARSVVTTRLRALEEAGLIQRRAYHEPGSRARDEYVLTVPGAELEPIVMGIFSWGRRHVAADAVLDIVHEGCGGIVDAVLKCEHGHVLNEDDLVLTTTNEAERVL